MFVSKLTKFEWYFILFLFLCVSSFIYWMENRVWVPGEGHFYRDFIVISDSYNDKIVLSGFPGKLVCQDLNALVSFDQVHFLKFRCTHRFPGRKGLEFNGKAYEFQLISEKKFGVSEIVPFVNEWRASKPYMVGFETRQESQ